MDIIKRLIAKNRRKEACHEQEDKKLKPAEESVPINNEKTSLRYDEIHSPAVQKNQKIEMPEGKIPQYDRDLDDPELSVPMACIYAPPEIMAGKDYLKINEYPFTYAEEIKEKEDVNLLPESEDPFVDPFEKKNK